MVTRLVSWSFAPHASAQMTSPGSLSRYSKIGGPGRFRESFIWHDRRARLISRSTALRQARPYSDRQRGILAHQPEQGLLINDDQPRATTARLQVK
jgi:hypothetical protein